MKKVLKQPVLWVACICFLAAIVIAIVGSVRDTTPAVVAKFERGFNKRDAKKMLSCMTPETQQLMEGLGADNLFDYIKEDAGSVRFLIGSVEEETGDSNRESVRVYTVYYDKKGEPIETDAETMGLVTIDGKQYLE